MTCPFQNWRIFNRVILALIFTCLFLPASHAEVYSWTDENGIRHFSNTVPPEQGRIFRMKETGPGHFQGQLFRVIRVFDGDTIQARGAGLDVKIRLVGIDAPETGRKGQKGQPFGKKAKQILGRLIMDRSVRLKQYGTGGYNRILAEVFSGATNINLTLVSQGLAEVYQGRLPPHLDISAYQSAQNRAKKNRAGIWSLGKAYLSPKQWRRENPRK